MVKRQNLLCEVEAVESLQQQIGSPGHHDFPPAAAVGFPESPHQAVPCPRGTEPLRAFILVLSLEEQGRQDLSQLTFTKVDETAQTSCRVTGEAAAPNKTAL